MAYINLQNCTLEEYTNIIYSQDDTNRLRIWFNNVELENADEYCEKVIVKSRILPDDGTKRFTLDNFVSKEVEVILHDIDTSIIQDQVRISIGTLVDEENDIYEDVPIGIFNIQDTPTTDKEKTTIKLRDNRVKFDFNYNALPLIESKGGSATYKDILMDICSQAGVDYNIISFRNENYRVAIYDNTIQATTYVSYIAEQGGYFPTIDRNGKLIFVDISNSLVWKIPLNLIEKYEMGKDFKIQRVVYESGIIKYETSSNESLDTLYLDSANPYIVSKQQIDYIYSFLNNIKISSVKTGKILGNPLIDPYDMVEVYGYYQENEDGDYEFVNDENTIVFRTLANNTYTYTGVHRNEFDTEIGEEARTENVSLNSEETFRRYAKTEIDNLNNSVKIVVGEINETNEKLGVIEASVDEIKLKIQDIADLTETKSTYLGTLEFEKVNASYPLKIEVRPTATEFVTYLYPSTNLYPSSSLYTQTRTLKFTNNDTNEVITYEIPNNLYYYDSKHYDRFIIDYEIHKCYIEKSCYLSANGTIQLLTALYPNVDVYPSVDIYPQAIERIFEYEYPTIALTNGDYTIEMVGYDNVYLSATLMKQNKYTTSFATTAELYSAIDQTAEEIKIEVSHKVDEEEVASYFDITAESITAKTGKFAIESDNFTLTEEGEITATKGTISKFSFDEDKLTVELTLPHTYTNDDVTRVTGIINGTIQPTSEDYNLYDFNQTNIIDDVDLEIVTNLANGTYSHTSTYTIDTTNPIKALSIDNGSTNTNIGAYSSYIDTIINDYTKSNQIELYDSATNQYIDVMQKIKEIENRLS